MVLRSMIAKKFCNEIFKNMDSKFFDKKFGPN